MPKKNMENLQNITLWLIWYIKNITISNLWGQQKSKSITINQITCKSKTDRFLSNTWKNVKQNFSDVKHA